MFSVFRMSRAAARGNAAQELPRLAANGAGKAGRAEPKPERKRKRAAPWGSGPARVTDGKHHHMARGAWTGEKPGRIRHCATKRGAAPVERPRSSHGFRPCAHLPVSGEECFRHPVSRAAPRQSSVCSLRPPSGSFGPCGPGSRARPSCDCPAHRQDWRRNAAPGWHNSTQFRSMHITGMALPRLPRIPPPFAEKSLFFRPDRFLIAGQKSGFR